MIAGFHYLEINAKHMYFISHIILSSFFKKLHSKFNFDIVNKH